jgi:hypothetical protein
MRFSGSRRLSPAASSVSKIIVRSHRWVRTICATKGIVDAHKAIVRYAGVIALHWAAFAAGTAIEGRRPLDQRGDVGLKKVHFKAVCEFRGDEAFAAATRFQM